MEVPFYIPHELEPLVRKWLGGGTLAAMDFVVGLLATLVFAAPLLPAVIVTIVTMLKRMRQIPLRKKLIRGLGVFAATYVLLLIVLIGGLRLVVNKALPSKVDGEATQKETMMPNNQIQNIGTNAPNSDL
jgi:hypothetical protein